ncbi:hypothetical protein ACFQZR_08525 [Paenibacillus sp. GCM10027629]|uniref:hypothetical protein n=1 Tax=Paenibacillus sp. GCM10027629 TaxID=3273414 RepID=UPI00364210EB
MFRVGDRVVFVTDGTVGIVMGIEEDRCQVIWEDCFASWEKKELLRKEDPQAMM